VIAAAVLPGNAAALVMPDGWRYQADFVPAMEESRLLDVIATLPFEAARYKEWTARRRIVSYGGRYDFSRNVLEPAEPIPQFLQSLRQQAADWGMLAVESLNHATIAEYRPNTQLGWHRDVPQFEMVIGISLAGRARMRFRPYPHQKGGRALFAIELEPRSIYLLAGPARWAWQHAISETAELRYSITFRTRRVHCKRAVPTGMHNTDP
jgi:alkylated DNA repair dioxygenase AlkB